MKKINIFAHLLISVIIPALLIFGLVILVINEIIIDKNNQREIENSSNYTYFSSKVIRTHYENYVNLLTFLKNRIYRDDLSYEESYVQMESVLGEVRNSIPEIFCVWLILENEDTERETRLFYPDYFEYDKDYNPFSKEILDNADLSPWYNIPYTTGEIYFDPIVTYDYEKVKLTNCSISAPIEVDGEIIGVIGFNISYDIMFDIASTGTANLRLYGLMTEDGHIFYSLNVNIKNKNFFDMAEDYGNDPDELKSFMLNDDISSANYISPFTAKDSELFILPLNLRHSGENIYLFMETPIELIVSSSDEAIKAVAFTALIGLIFISVSVYFSTKRIVDPIKSLIGNAKKIAVGDLDVVFFTEYDDSADSRNEIAQLNSALKDMMEQQTRSNILRTQKMNAEMEREKAVASAKAKTNFFANISHELCTPMNSILGLIQILALEGGFNNRQLKHIMDIKLSAESLQKIINDILDLSKLESGKIKLTPVHFNFTQMLDNISAKTTLLSAEKGIGFTFEASGDIPECLYLDDYRLRQILMNVLKNAVKFTSNGGVKLRVMGDTDTMTFEITDTGVGIPHEIIENIFNSFENIGIKTSQSGIGTGLAITKKLLELMEGDISIESAMGVGSAVRVTIPKVLGDLQKIKKREIKINEKYYSFAENTKILIVDDNEINLNVASNLIEVLYGIECDVALSGKEALISVKNNDYDLIFMDHMMPEMDGIETTQNIRNLGGKFKDIPIVALTANAVIGVKDMFIDAGMNDFLSKPINKNAMSKVVLRWIPEEKIIKEIEPYMSENQVFTPQFSVLSGIEKIAGLDVNLGLANVAERREVYEKSLQIFKNRMPGLAVSMQEYLDNDDISNFEIQIHGLKSSLASIGAVSLSKSALQIEMAAKNNQLESCKEMLPVFLNRVENLTLQLNEVFKRSESVNIRPLADEKDYCQRIEKIKASYTDYDFELIAAEVQELLQSDYGEKLNTTIEELKLLTETFDYLGIGQFLENLSDIPSA